MNLDSANEAVMGKGKNWRFASVVTNVNYSPVGQQETHCLDLQVLV
jgi:hypothetical protein